MNQISVTGKRASGRTTTLVAAVIMQALKPGSDIAVMAPSITHLNHIRKILRDSLADDMIQLSSMLEMRLVNGSVIHFNSVAANAAKGKSYYNTDLLAFDNLDCVDMDAVGPSITTAKRLIYTQEEPKEAS